MSPSSYSRVIMSPELKNKILCLQRIICVGNRAQQETAAARLREIRLRIERTGGMRSQGRASLDGTGRMRK